MSTALQVRSFKISLFSKPHSWYGSGLLLIWLFPGFSCREIAFKLSTSYSLWPTKAYEVCIRKRSWIVTSVIHYHIIALRTRHCELGIAADFFLCRGGRIEFLLFFFFFFFFFYPFLSFQVLLSKCNFLLIDYSHFISTCSREQIHCSFHYNRDTIFLNRYILHQEQVGCNELILLRCFSSSTQVVVSDINKNQLQRRYTLIYCRNEFLWSCGKFKCHIYEMVLMRKRRAAQNTQKDSIQRKGSFDYNTLLSLLIMCTFLRFSSSYFILI